MKLTQKLLKEQIEKIMSERLGDEAEGIAGFSGTSKTTSGQGETFKGDMDNYASPEDRAKAKKEAEKLYNATKVKLQKQKADYIDASNERRLEKVLKRKAAERGKELELSAEKLRQTLTIVGGTALDGVLKQLTFLTGDTHVDAQGNEPQAAVLPLKGRRDLVDLFLKDKKLQRIVQDQLSFMVATGDLKGSPQTNQQNWDAAYGNIIVRSLMPAMKTQIQNPPKKGLGAKIKGFFGFEESLTLSSDDIRKMIQEEIANIKKENNG